MTEIIPEKAEKKPEKFYTKLSKPHGAAVLPFYIMGILMQVHRGTVPPVTVMQVQKILIGRKLYYDPDTIRRALNNLHMHSPDFELVARRVRTTGTNKCYAYSIRFKDQLL